MLVLVVDDESDILHLIFRALRNEGYDTIGAETAEEALVQFNNNPVDIVLLDLMLPDKSGYDVLEQLKTINPTLPVIILTALDTRLNKISGLELGADDYVTKPFDAKELASRVKALWRRVNYPLLDSFKNKKNKQIIELGHFQLNPISHELKIDKRDISLTDKEFRVLYFMVTHHHQLLDREQFIEQIWGYNFASSTRAVDAIIKRLRDKLRPYENCITTVYGCGYIFKEDIDR